ncbi:hypothetical protein AH6C_015 [Aeromonas phage pAh6-C]|uniref:Uncharacterized protein n=1 Tax=Aeromonas phage pAh6-C TaxID=1505227 RepID=A0A076GAF1_9CAUD|nr:hypothetical protein AH6C_015 [Aeromonas phage pAh6-C]AII26769.1 hypothetical protein AH6C_015 [Aeromonas phage pAh6-C]
MDEALNTVDRLNALGKLVHVVTLRGVRKNCVIRQYDAINDVTNSYSVPIALTLEQMNVVDLTRSTVQVSTNYSNGEVVAQEQATVRRVVPEAATVENAINPAAVQLLAAPVSRAVQATAISDGEVPDIVPASFYEMEHREVPFSTGFDTRFIYEGTEYTLGRVRYNVTLGCFVTILQWRKDGKYETIASLPLQSGVNLVRQYATNMPSFVAVNTQERNSDPSAPENLRLYIIKGFDETFLGL